MTIVQKRLKDSPYKLEWLSLILSGDIPGTISLQLPLPILRTTRDWLLIALLGFWTGISANGRSWPANRSILATIMYMVSAGGVMATLKRGIGWLILKLLLKNMGTLNLKNVILTIG